jgi:CHAD domain-containing protein
VDSQLRALLDSESVARIGTDPEGVHQMRVALRRLRAVLPAITTAPAGELRWLGGRLGAVRDLDVQIAYFRGATEGFDDDELGAVGRLLGPLVTERDKANARLRRTLSGRRYRKLCRTLADVAATPWEPPASTEDPTDPATVIARPYRKLRAAVSTMDDSDAALHRVRIKAKRLRYAAELVEPTGGKPVRALVKATKRLQDVLGEHQDAVVAEQLIRDLASRRRPADQVFVAGRLVERERARQRASRQAWRAAYDEVLTCAAAVTT